MRERKKEADSYSMAYEREKEGEQMSCGRQMLNDETRLQEQTQMLRMERVREE